jgi:DNA-binding NtrC family response regulator
MAHGRRRQTVPKPVDATTQVRSVGARASRPVRRWLFPVFSGGKVLAVEGRPLRGGSVAIGRAPGGKDDLQLDDPAASRRHAEVRGPADGPFEIVDLDSRNGTEVDGRPVKQAPLGPSAVIRVGDSYLVYVEVELPAGLDDLEPKGESPSWAVSCRMADLAAPSGLPVLVLGPTGAGKELLAQRIHDGSGRSGPLLPVNCGAMPSDLLASELFGHSAGAYTGAQSARQGLFVAAHGGSLFLDEIGELPLEQQPVLLRVLQEGRVRPVGSDRERPVDVRVVAATHRSLAASVERGAFRRDLYHRLAGFEVRVDGLAKRREDILALFAKFCPSPLDHLAAQALLLYDWPGNVRELKAVAQQVRLLARDGTVEVSHLPVAIREHETGSSADVEDPGATLDGGEAPSREDLEALLRRHDGNVASVGRDLGRHRQQVYRWLKRYGLDPASFRSEG